MLDLTIPAGSAVTAATGDGYKGVHRDAQAKADVAERVVPRIAAKDHQVFTITLSKPATVANNLRGNIRWAKPAPKSGSYRDFHDIAPPQI